MKTSFLVLLCCLLSACATRGLPPPSAADLFHDELFKPPAMPINPDDALAITEPMIGYAQTKLRHPMGHVDAQDRRIALVNAMYKKGELKLDYDATQTLTAAQAFDAKRGNCLSLVLLTAVMAKQEGLPTHFQSVIGTTDWSKSDNFFMSIGHVNLVLESIPAEFEQRTYSPIPVVIDFLAPDRASVLETTEISEETVLAMFANNRAVETLIQGDVDDAYWWAKAALQKDPKFFNSYITLGVIYRTAHHSEFAAKTLERVALYEPDNTTMLSNQILVLKDLGRTAQADAMAQKLAKLDQHPPWGYYLEAQAEYAAGHYETARHLYEREIARDPDHHEFEYGLAQVYVKLNDLPRALKHMQRAFELSLSPANREFYAQKIEKLKTAGLM